jgi:hypothetical protein
MNQIDKIDYPNWFVCVFPVGKLFEKVLEHDDAIKTHLKINALRVEICEQGIVHSKTEFA